MGGYRIDPSIYYRKKLHPNHFPTIRRSFKGAVRQSGACLGLSKYRTQIDSGVCQSTKLITKLDKAASNQAVTVTQPAVCSHPISLRILLLLRFLALSSPPRTRDSSLFMSFQFHKARNKYPLRYLRKTHFQSLSVFKRWSRRLCRSTSLKYCLQIEYISYVCM